MSPRTLQSESGVLGTLLTECPTYLPPYVSRLIGHAPDSFDDPRCGQVANAIKRSTSKSNPVNVLQVERLLNGSIDHSFIGNLMLQFLPPGLLEVEAKTLWEQYRQRRIRATVSEAHSHLQSNPSSIETILRVLRHTLGQLENESGDSLETLEFKPNVRPPPLRPVYRLAGHCIATPGNICTITSAVKAGKSAVIGAMIASAMRITHDADCLGFTSDNPEQKALLHFDSEQAPDDFWHCGNRALRRAGLENKPKWFHAYCLTGRGYQKSWEFILRAIQSAREIYGGIHSILIDGAADVVKDVNDPGEAQDKIAEFHAIAIENDCPIVGVIHFNPGSEKTRGHLGSQLERKAETNLRLDKENEVTTIWSDKQRRAPIPKNSGPCFAWSAEREMHITVSSRQQSKDDVEAGNLREVFADVFSSRPAMRYSDLQVTVKTRLTVSAKTAERKVTRAVTLGIIKKTIAGLYELAT